ncbi:MAG: hypothetical protein ACPGGB_05605, partial [Flavobacteriales bacterium]
MDASNIEEFKTNAIRDGYFRLNVNFCNDVVRVKHRGRPSEAVSRRSHGLSITIQRSATGRQEWLKFDIKSICGEGVIPRSNPVRGTNRNVSVTFAHDKGVEIRPFRAIHNAGDRRVDNGLVHAHAEMIHHQTSASQNKLLHVACQRGDTNSVAELRGRRTKAQRNPRCNLGGCVRQFSEEYIV